jgi:hypothetical protein
MLSFKKIFEETQVSWNTGNYTDIAYNSGKSIRMLLDFSPDRRRMYDVGVEAETEQDYFQLAMDFVGEFSIATTVLNTTNTIGCKDAMIGIDSTITNAVNIFKDGGSTRDGVFLVADVFGLTYPLNFQCYTGVTEAENILLDYYKTFDSPLTIFFHLVYNFGRVFDDLSSMVDCGKAMDAKCLGASIGDITYVLFF